MYVVQIADLHIGSETECGEPEEIILAGAVEKIKSEIPEGQQLLVCVCGDIIDSKDLRREKLAAERYKDAAALFALMQEQLSDSYAVSFKFCVGNHDTTHMDNFFDFVHQFDAELSKDELENCYVHTADGIHFIMINSCRDGNYEYGEINCDRLEQLLKSLPPEDPKIFVMHHTVISMYRSDSSSIRDSARVLRMIESNHVLGVLHGHIHGNERFPFGTRMCQMIGAGALFSRGNPNVCSQFNLIYVDPFAFRNLSTYIYLADNRIQGDHWHKFYSQEDGNENYFQGPDFSSIHKRLLGKLKYKPVLNNVVLQINCTYDKFIKDLEQYLRDELLSMGQKQFPYFELAEKWESTTLPPDLYFNHGTYFQLPCPRGTGEPEHAIHTISRLIKEAPTSNRMVLTTFNANSALQPRQGNDYLPSLLSIQFSLDSKQSTLYVHMSLRALEAESFLKINICEILWLLKQMKERSVPFEYVDIAISAFRVQRRERFKCFLKAEIDNINSAELYGYVFRCNIEKICCMLEEKADSSETITNVQGIKALYDAILIAKEDCLVYTNEILEELRSILDAYNNINKLQLRSSVRTNEEKDCEEQIRQGLFKIIEILKQKDGATGHDA